MRHLRPAIILRSTLLLACLALAAICPSPASANDTARYQVPAQPMVDMVDAAQIPQTTLSPNNEWLMLLERPALPSVADLSQPELRLAGLRINPRNNDLSRTTHATAIRFVRLADRLEKLVQNVPANARIGDAVWSPDGKRVAFTLVRENALDLMVVEVANGTQARRVTERNLNGVVGRPFSWFSDSKSLLIAAIPQARGAAPKAPSTASGPLVQENLGRRNAARTYQDLLKTPHDEALFEYYATAEVARVWLDGKLEAIVSGVVRGMMPSPDGQYALVQTIKRPYSYSVPVSRFALKTEVRDALEPNVGRVVRVMSDLPMAEDEESDPDAVRKGPRQYSWRSDANATLAWAQANETRKNGISDYFFVLPSPFDGEPTMLAKLELRFQSVNWGNDAAALVTEVSRKLRKTSTWRVYPSDATKPAQKIFERSTEDRYSDPGTPFTESNGRGGRVLNFSPDGRAIYLNGTGASADGDRPFVDRLELDTRETKRLFRSEAPYYDVPLSVFDSAQSGKTANANVRLLMQRETVTEAPNVYVRELASGKMSAVTRFATPKNPLAGVTKEVIRYKRRDGVELSGTLYLPATFKRGDDPLPLLMWAYPREFRSAEAAGQITGSPHRYVRPAFSGPLPFITQGYAVLDNPTMPIIGEQGKENDTYLPQLIASAEAAIDEVVRRGVADRSKIAVGGHSYGAFMVANLLAHTKLFAAGIAESGAYNRTLTPFGFQAEDRTFWKARDVYAQMSPFNYADQIKTPILLIHGEADSNSGTFPLQSERFYQAIKGLGGTARYVVLPYEDHGYRGRESVLHRLWESVRWLDRYVKNGDKRPA
ncbi:MAG: S9 family peptidase [Rhodocyclaceae bacterium]|nr:S9 family peptidase [Rhodocyclaceae bacterium]MCA3033173.1 S9 family peptidase [Rhodocyclaceae bacterium]MCA3036565.1 S9 family peptidase [Rhodocyclaceae bacterium]MCA3040094.1 S9 family peptidase [Rhodocyclaceae bacterium]MCA3045485.1 S9 family peptidase [Rhodocyclaceae bacterium]